jgi:hypothetical protein
MQTPEADLLRAEAEALKDRARLEDLSIWTMEKVKSTKKGSRTYYYWMATWREGSRTRNVHLGSCVRMDADAALQKARAMKAEVLGSRSKHQIQLAPDYFRRQIQRAFWPPA